MWLCRDETERLLRPFLAEEITAHEVMALGANRMNVIRLVLHGAFLQLLIGLAIGIPVSIACSHLIAAQLYQVKGWDPLVLSGSVLALGLCALVASVIPAQRAASVNPVNASRAE